MKPKKKVDDPNSLEVEIEILANVPFRIADYVEKILSTAMAKSGASWTFWNMPTKVKITLQHKEPPRDERGKTVLAWDKPERDRVKSQLADYLKGEEK